MLRAPHCRHWQWHIITCTFGVSISVRHRASYCCSRKGRAGSKLHTAAASNDRDHALQSLHYCLFVPLIYGYYSSRTSRSWWIARSTQRHRRGCNITNSYLSYHKTGFYATDYYWLIDLMLHVTQLLLYSFERALLLSTTWPRYISRQVLSSHSVCHHPEPSAHAVRGEVDG